MLDYYVVQTGDKALTPHSFARAGLKKARRLKHSNSTGRAYQANVKPGQQAFATYRRMLKEKGLVTPQRHEKARKLGVDISETSLSLVDTSQEQRYLNPKRLKVFGGEDFEKLHTKPKHREDRLERNVGRFVLASDFQELTLHDVEFLAETKKKLRQRIDQMLMQGLAARNAHLGVPLAFLGFRPGSYFEGAFLFSHRLDKNGKHSLVIDEQSAPQIAQTIARNLEGAFLEGIASNPKITDARDILRGISNVTMASIDLAREFDLTKDPDFNTTMKDAFVMRNVMKFIEFLMMVKNNLNGKAAQFMKARVFTLLDMVETNGLAESDLMKRKLLVALKYSDLTSKQARRLMTNGKKITAGQLGINKYRAKADLQSDLDISPHAFDSLLDLRDVDSRAANIRPELLGTDDGLRSLDLGQGDLRLARNELEATYADSGLGELVSSAQSGWDMGL